MTVVQTDAQLFQLCTEFVYQSRAYIRLRHHPVAQSLLQKIDLVTESPTSPTITKFACRSLQREDSITPAMKTSATNTISLD